MIRADAFVAELRSRDFGLFSGVPCSYLTPLINTVIGSPGVDYVGAANEGDAVAVASGAALGGVRGAVLLQNSGLGNAVSPLTSLNAVFRVPVLVLVTWRGQPGGPADEPQHELMGRITPQLLETMGIPWEVAPQDEGELTAALDRAVAHMDAESTPFALVVRKGTFSGDVSAGRPRPQAPRLTDGAGPPAPAIDQDDALRAVQNALGDRAAVIATTGYTGRALYALGDRPNQLYMVGSMGCVSSLGLGLAKARPERRVVVLDGDGAMLMRLGAVAMIGNERPANLTHVLLDNGVHDSTGSQNTLSPAVDLAAVACACGYPEVVRPTSADELRGVLRSEPGGLTFVHVRTEPRRSRELPRPDIEPASVAERFRGYIAGS